MPRIRVPLSAIFAFAFFLVPSVLSAQETGRVTGQVLDRQDQGVDGAQVVVVGTDVGTITDAEGRFEMRGVPVGNQTLRVQAIGYSETERQVQVQAGQTVEQNLRVREAAVEIEDVQVQIGSRVQNRAAQEQAVPVQVITEQAMEATGSAEIATKMIESVPSIHFPRNQVADLTSGNRPFQMRGLSPNHSLVLLNGKRRHQMASLNVFGSILAGSSGVDLNSIPSAMIATTEVLKNNASAQYGSDAIAGVINFRLKDTPQALNIRGKTGRFFPENFPNDGLRLNGSVSKGWELGDDRGAFVVAGEFYRREETQRSGCDQRPMITDNDADVCEDVDGDDVKEVVDKQNPVNQPAGLWGDGEATSGMVFYNTKYRLSGGADSAQLYSFGGVSYRQDQHPGFLRRSKDDRNWPQIHPNGFLPTFDVRTRDISAAAGVRGNSGDLNWDAYASYGQNRTATEIQNSINASLGPCMDEPCAPGRDGVLGTEDDPGIANKTAFDAGALVNGNLDAGIDISTPLGADLGGGDIGLATGLSGTLQHYQVVPGEPASYINGFHESQNGGIAASGSQVFTGYKPPKTDEWRPSFGSYIEVEFPFTDALLVSTAGRYEYWSDFGSSLTGRIASRVQFSDQFILRGSASTGFNAPTMAQKFYRHTSTAFMDVEGEIGQQAFEVGEFPVQSEAAQRLGAQPLEPETSVAYSTGFAVTPIAEQTQNLHLTVDGYFIDVENRLILSGTLGPGGVVEDLLEGLQARAGRFMTDALDTETKGISASARYRNQFSPGQILRADLTYNWTSTEVTEIRVPDPIEGLQDDLFSPGEVVALEKGRPRHRANGHFSFTTGPVQTNWTVKVSGPVTSLVQVQPEELRNFGHHVQHDVSVGYDVTDDLTWTVGGENITDDFPICDCSFEDAGVFDQIFTYESGSPFGFNGRYLYSRFEYTF